MAGPGTTGPGTTRATHKAQTHEALRSAAFELFARQGYAATRVADITAAVGVSDRTFFRYFASKEDVASAGLQAWIDELFLAIESLPDTYGPVEAIAAVLRQADAGRFSFGQEQARDVVAYLQFPEVRHHFTRITERQRLRLITDFARRGGMAETDAYPRVLGAVVTAGLFAVMESWLFSASTGNPWHLVRDTLATVATDLSTTAFTPT